MLPSGLLTRASCAKAAVMLTPFELGFLAPMTACATLPGKNSRVGLSGNQMALSKEDAWQATANQKIYHHTQ